jgi:hypothetical protein
MSGKTKTKTKVTPYDAPAIKAGEGALNTAYGQTQNTINQYSPALNTAIQKIQQNIAAPPQYMTDAAGQLDKTIKGDYLDPSTNPYSSGMAKLIADQTAGEYGATYGAAGRSHGGMAALLSSQGVGNALNGFYGGLYEAERGRQQQAVQGAPAFHQGEYTDINELFPAVQNTAMLPLNAANSYAGGLGSLIAPYSTQTTTQKQGFGLQQAIGLAAAVAGAASGNPMAISGGLNMAASSGGQMSAVPIAPSNYSPYGAFSQAFGGFGG